MAQISPVVDVYRSLKRVFQKTFETSYSGSTHTTPNTDDAVLVVASKIRELSLFEESKQRSCRKPSADLISEGYDKAA
jgi:hypothetical protein